MQAEYAEEEELIMQSADREQQRERVLARDIADMTRLRGSKQVRKSQGA